MQVIKKLEISGHAGAIYDICGNETSVFTASGDHFVAKWDLIRGVQDKFSIKAENAVYTLACVNNGKYLVFACSNGSMHVIDIENKIELKHFTQHKVAVFSSCENKVKKELYLGDAAGNLSVWDTEEWKLKLFLPFDCGKIRSIFLFENQLYLSCQDEKIRVLDSLRFNEISQQTAHKQGTNCFSIFPQKPHIGISGGKDGFLRLWKIPEFEKIIEIPAHNFGIYAIEFFNHGACFVTISRDKSIKIWDAKRLEVIQKIERKQGGHSHSVNAIHKVNEGEFVTVGDDKRIILWGIEIDSQNIV
jgi:WD40 repeat protein